MWGGHPAEKFIRQVWQGYSPDRSIMPLMAAVTGLAAGDGRAGPSGSGTGLYDPQLMLSIGGLLTHSCRPGPRSWCARSAAAAVIILPAAQTALVEAAVFGVLDVPFVANVQLAQQGPDHGKLRSLFPIMALTRPPEKRGTAGPAGTTRRAKCPKPAPTIKRKVCDG